MLAERPYYISPIEQELHFTEWAKENGIKQFLFDLDDTICNTTKVFHEGFLKIAEFLAQNHSFLSREQWHEEIKIINNYTFEKYGVNPNKWNYGVDEMSHKYEIAPEIKVGVGKLLQGIYETPIEMLDGSEICLNFLTKINIPIGIVTHANRGDTFKKYNWLKLDRFLNWDDVYIVDENGHKTHESWQEAIKYFHLNPQDCAVIGDSPRSDINPAYKAGVQHCFLIESSSSWSIHKQPVHPDTRIIKNLSQLIEIGTGKL